MENDKGDVVDLYIPRKCSVTSRLIPAKDHSSVQINVAILNEAGVMENSESYKTYVVSGMVRSSGESDDSLSRLCQRDGLLQQ